MYKITVPVISAQILTDDDRVATLSELKRIGAQRIYLAMDTLCYDKTEKEYEFNLLKENTEYFKAQGLEVGTWIWTFWMRGDNDFVKIRGAGESSVNFFACPLDEKF